MLNKIDDTNSITTVIPILNILIIFALTTVATDRKTYQQLIKFELIKSYK